MLALKVVMAAIKEQREKVSAFSLFLLPIVISCQKLGVILRQSNP